MSDLRPGSPIPPPMAEDVFGDEDDQDKAKKRVNSWMTTRIMKDDIGSVPMRGLVLAVANMIAVRSPSQPDFLNYMDQFMTLMNDVIESYTHTKVTDLTTKKKAKEDEEDWKRYKHEGNLPDFVVPDDPEEDEDFENEDDEDFEPSGEDEDRGCDGMG